MAEMDANVEARVLVADPPWKFGDSLPGKGRGAEKHYSCMTTQELCAMELPPTASDCVLLMWRVAAMQREALDVMDAWGFTLKSELVWRKLTKTGKRHFGMGRHVRMEHEVCLIGVRVRVAPLNHSTRSVFEAPVGRHSEKPDAFYELAEQLYPGPHVELFARRRRPGWTCYGDELEQQWL